MEKLKRENQVLNSKNQMALDSYQKTYKENQQLHDKVQTAKALLGKGYKDFEETKTQVDLNTKDAKRFEERHTKLIPEYIRHIHNEKQEIKGNIRVFCRVRPVQQEEKDKPLDQVIKANTVTTGLKVPTKKNKLASKIK
jgi:hypothetical protein